MHKLHALRAHILAAVPALQHAPERLLTFVEEGSIRWRAGTNYDHGYSYDARLIVTDYSGEVDALIVPLLSWMATYNPDVPLEQAVRFEAEILANDCYDLSLIIPMTERVKARADCEAGRINAEHLIPIHDDRAACGPGAWSLYLRNHREDADYRLVAQWTVAEREPNDGG